MHAPCRPCELLMNLYSLLEQRQKVTCPCLEGYYCLSRPPACPPSAAAFFFLPPSSSILQDGGDNNGGTGLVREQRLPAPRLAGNPATPARLALGSGTSSSNVSTIINNSQLLCHSLASSLPSLPLLHSELQRPLTELTGWLVEL